MHQPRADTLRRISPAFTLIEILVVVAIIAILASLLLPALARAKRQGQKTACLNNIKQLTLTISLHAADSEDVMPWPNWANANGRQGWLYGYDSTQPGPAAFAFTNGQFWPIILNRKNFRCPNEDTNAPLFLARAQQLSSYCMNGATCGYGRAFPPFKLGDIRGDGIAFWEQDERAPGYFNDGSNYPTEGVSLRHGEGALIGNYSGNAEQVSAVVWYNEAADPAKTRLWCAPDTANGR